MFDFKSLVTRPETAAKPDAQMLLVGFAMDKFFKTETGQRLLGEVNKIVDAGTAEKVIAFAMGLEETNARLGRIEALLAGRNAGGVGDGGGGPGSVNPPSGIEGPSDLPG